MAIYDDYYLDLYNQPSKKRFTDFVKDKLEAPPVTFTDFVKDKLEAPPEVPRKFAGEFFSDPLNVLPAGPLRPNQPPSNAAIDETYRDLQTAGLSEGDAWQTATTGSGPGGNVYGMSRYKNVPNVPSALESQIGGAQISGGTSNIPNIPVTGTSGIATSNLPTSMQQRAADQISAASGAPIAPLPSPSALDMQVGNLPVPFDYAQTTLPGQSPSNVSTDLLNRQTGFIPPTPSTMGLGTTGTGGGSLIGEQARQQDLMNRQAQVESQIPSGQYTGSPDALQSIVESRTENVLPPFPYTSTEDVLTGGTDIVSQINAGIDAIKSSASSAGEMIGNVTGAGLNSFGMISSSNGFMYDLFKGEEGGEGSSGMARRTPEAQASIDNFLADMESRHEGAFDGMSPDVAAYIADSMANPNNDSSLDKSENDNSDETGKTGGDTDVFEGSGMGLADQFTLQGFNQMTQNSPVDTRAALTLTDELIDNPEVTNKADLITFLKQISEPLKINEGNLSPKLPVFPASVINDLTKEVQIPNTSLQGMTEEEMIATGQPRFITTYQIDPAGEALLNFYNEYVLNALSFGREAQNYKTQLLIAEANANPYGLTNEDQLEIEEIRANPYGLTNEQAVSLERNGLDSAVFTKLQEDLTKAQFNPYGLNAEDWKTQFNPYALDAEDYLSAQRQGLGEQDFLNKELQLARIAAQPGLVQAAGSFLNPSTIAGLGGAFLPSTGRTYQIPQEISSMQTLGQTGGGTSLNELSSGLSFQPLGGTQEGLDYLSSIEAAVPNSVSNALRTGNSLTLGGLQQLQQENPTALELYFGALANQGISQDQAIQNAFASSPGEAPNRGGTLAPVQLGY